jgi:hypothetical protein
MTERLHHVADKKGQILSKMLRVNSAPDTSVIATIQDRLNNPLFKLSIADYELMCGNKMLLKMMAKTLKCDEKQLKKFCKYINIFKENINSSPKSIRNKMKPTSSLSQLPDNILGKIVEKYKDLFPAKYVLRRWIPLNELAWNSLSANPNAIELLKENQHKINWKFLSSNPNAIELLRENQDKINWKMLSENPNSIELLRANQDKIDWERLSINPNAITLLKNNIHKIDWKMLSANPNAIELLRANKDKIDWEELIANPNAIGLIKENLDEVIDFCGLYGLALNENTEALELLQKYPQYIIEEGTNLSSNPNPKAIDLLRDNINITNWDWQLLSFNPSLEALKLLRENPEKIDWEGLSANPIIFEEVSSEYSVEKYQDNTSKVPLTFKTVEDVQRWFKDPEKHPIKGTPMPAMSNEYYNIYETAYIIMKKYDFKSVEMKHEYGVIKNHFPKNHLLFGDIDLVYYACVKKNVKFFSKLYEGREEALAICKLLTEKIEDTVDATTVLDKEMDLLRNRFNSTPIWDKRSTSNMVLIKELIDEFRGDLVNAFFDKDYMYRYEYPQRVKAIQEDAGSIDGYWFIKFLENNKMANGQTPVKYFINFLKKPYAPNWISQALKLYNDYKLLIKDIDECFNPESGIVENAEDKKITPINDPIDEYFEFYEKKLAEIRKPIYSQLIDLTTFKPKENLKYLNDAEYAAFKRERDRYDTERKKYSDIQTLYETTKKGSSPKPPEKPKITLPWGTVHTIGRQIDPMHIKDEIVVKFMQEYTNAMPIIEEYNRVRNMSYKELMRNVGNSPSSSKKRFIEGNRLLSMTREDIANNILYDNTGLADKCSENIDILTNEELNDENYPLAKLQLMVQLKVYTPDKNKYRTECIYAPKLYNYLIKCINSKEPFINPVTKTKYTQENIEQLMKVMRIIDPKIEVPVFIKHRNDTKLKLNYITHTVNIRNLGADASFGSVSILYFNEMYLSRMIAGVEKVVHVICFIPDGIEATGTFATGSADLNSYTMLANIYKLFNEGRLLYNYLPPYKVLIEGTNRYTTIKPQIHFNRFRTINNWIRKANFNDTLLTKEEFIDRFKHYAQEVNNYVFS